MPIQRHLSDKGARPGALFEDSASFIEPKWAELSTVDRYRRAARGIVEAGLPAGGADGWRSVLVKLGVEIHTELRDPERRWAQLAVGEEVRSLFGDDPEAGCTKAPPRSATDPLRRLRALGHSVCPTCFTPVPTPKEFERWSGLELLAAKRRDARKEAIGHGGSR